MTFATMPAREFANLAAKDPHLGKLSSDFDSLVSEEGGLYDRLAAIEDEIRNIRNEKGLIEEKINTRLEHLTAIAAGCGHIERDI